MQEKVAAPHLFSYLALCTVVFSNILGNVFVKMGSSADPKDAIVFGLFGWPTLVGICFFASGLLLYAWALKFVSLHVAQTIIAIQYVGVIFASWICFREVIGLRQWIGIFLVFAGLAVLRP